MTETQTEVQKPQQMEGKRKGRPPGGKKPPDESISMQAAKEIRDLCVLVGKEQLAGDLIVSGKLPKDVREMFVKEARAASANTPKS